MKHSTLCVALLFIATSKISGQETKNLEVDYNGFLNITKELAEYRQARLIDIETFNECSQEKNTIILDTRSKKAYDEIHLKGAIHLNFSDFTKAALKRVIGDKNTRILIYCNNNFESPLEALMSKSTPLALNIPTFINLYGYDYKNMYELDEYLDQDDPRVQFEGTKVDNQH